MTPPQQGPWSEHLMLAESIGQAVADAMGAQTGSAVELGKASSFEPETVLPGRPVPLRAIVVNFRRPLRDVIVFLTSHKEDVVRPLIEAASEAAIGALDVPTSADQHGPLGQFTIDEAVEYETIDLALEQTDALFLEASYALELPLGEMLMIVGTGLLESAACFVNGVPDPHAVEAAFQPAGSELELGDEIGASEDGDRYELGDDIGVAGSGPRYELGGDIGLGGNEPRYELGEGAIGGDVDPALQTGTAASASGAGEGAGIDAYEAMLAAQEQAEADAAAAIAAASDATATANAAAAGHQAEVEATERWTQLLSGVEVELSAELGRTDLALGDITSLDSESVLTLDQMVHEPVDVYVNGTRYATARLVIVDGEYGIEILEVVDQGGLLETALAA